VARISASTGKVSNTMRGFKFSRAQTCTFEHAVCGPCVVGAAKVSGLAQAPSRSGCHYQDALFDIMVTARFHGESKGNIEVAPLSFHLEFDHEHVPRRNIWIKPR
jgi:hypothetical protein